MEKASQRSYWETIQARLANKEYVSAKQIRDVLSVEEDVPADLAHYVRGRLSESSRRGRPRHTREQAAQRLEKSVDLGLEMSLRQAGYRLQNMSAARDRALESVAKDYAMSPETLRDRLGKELRRYPKTRHFLTLAPEGDAMLTKMLEGGLVRLDPERGCVRVDEDELRAATAPASAERRLSAHRRSREPSV